MPKKFVPRGWQPEALTRVAAAEAFALLAEPGLGKTPVAWTEIVRYLSEDFEAKVLVVGPRLVAREVWLREAAKWTHTAQTPVRLITAEDFGLRRARKRAVAAVDGVEVCLDKGDLEIGAPEAVLERLLGFTEPVHIVSRDQLYWLAKVLRSRWPYRFVVVDEATSFCNPDAKRTTALRAMRQFGLIDRLLIMTGSPMPRDASQLWAQIHLLDRGARLGKTISEFRRRYQVPVQTDRDNPHIVFRWGLKPGAMEQILDAIEDISMSVKVDPARPGRPRTVQRLVSLPGQVLRHYREMERQKLTRVPETLRAVNAGVLVSKLLQLASGSVIAETGGLVQVHTVKLEVLQEILEELGDTPVLIMVWFKENQALIRRTVKGVRGVTDRGAIDAFLQGDCTRLISNPASAGHGLDGLQRVCHHLVVYDMIHNLEYYSQQIQRLDRSGQQKEVVVQQILAEGTIDEDMPQYLARKGRPQAELMEGLLRRRTALYT